MSEKKIVPGTGGDHYIPYEEHTGNEVHRLFYTGSVRCGSAEDL